MIRCSPVIWEYFRDRLDKFGINIANEIHIKLYGDKGLCPLLKNNEHIQNKTNYNISCYTDYNLQQLDTLEHAIVHLEFKYFDFGKPEDFKKMYYLYQFFKRRKNTHVVAIEATQDILNSFDPKPIDLDNPLYVAYETIYVTTNLKDLIAMQGESFFKGIRFFDFVCDKKVFHTEYKTVEASLSAGLLLEFFEFSKNSNMFISFSRNKTDGMYTTFITAALDNWRKFVYLYELKAHKRKSRVGRNFLKIKHFLEKELFNDNNCK